MISKQANNPYYYPICSVSFAGYFYNFTLPETKKMKKVKLVATDLDGTFLRNDRSISKANLLALDELGKKGILRVVATGRNLRKAREVLGDDIPFDYVVFSSGAGVFNWKTKQHIYHQNIIESSAQKLLSHFIRKGESFHAFFPVPENHQHYYYRGTEPSEEFERYFTFNQYFAEELNTDALPQTELCQFLVIIKENEKHFNELKTEIEALCPEIRVVRTSSPITKGYIWIEVFHRLVSKGNGVLEVCRRHNIDPKQTMAIGNDYNDFDLLAFARHSFLTANAPHEIKNRFPLLPSNEEDAFARAVELLQE